MQISHVRMHAIIKERYVFPKKRNVFWIPATGIWRLASGFWRPELLGMELPFGHLKNGRYIGHMLQHSDEVLAVGVRDEDLPKLFAAHQMNDTLYALCVQFVENVV